MVMHVQVDVLWAACDLEAGLLSSKDSLSHRSGRGI